MNKEQAEAQLCGCGQFKVGGWSDLNNCPKFSRIEHHSNISGVPPELHFHDRCFEPARILEGSRTGLIDGGYSIW